MTGFFSYYPEIVRKEKSIPWVKYTGCWTQQLSSQLYELCGLEYRLLFWSLNCCIIVQWPSAPHCYLWPFFLQQNGIRPGSPASSAPANSPCMFHSNKDNTLPFQIEMGIANNNGERDFLVIANNDMFVEKVVVKNRQE